MGNPTLTKLIFAGLISTFIVVQLFGVYSGFLVLNNGTIEEPYNTAIQEIGSQYAEFEDSAEVASEESLVKNILDFGRDAITGTVNVFVVGLEAIGSFFTIVPIVGNIISIIGETIPGLQGLLGLASVLVALYVAARYIQSASNKNDLP